MASFILEIEEIYNTISRPVIMQIAKDVIKLTDFDKDCDIYFKGFSNQGVNKESVMEQDKKESVNFSHKNRVLLSAETKYIDPNIYSAQPHRSEFRPIFYDKEHNITLSPINYEIEVELTLNFISKDRPTIEKWRSDIRRKLGQSVKSYLHRIDYTFSIDNKFITVLNHLYAIKGINIENTISFNQWLENISLEKISAVVNQIGNGQTIIVEQSQLGVTGLWSDTVPEIEKMESGDLYQANLSYLFRYSQPTSLAMQYPIMLNNTLISSKYRVPCDYNSELILGDPEKLIWGLNFTRYTPPTHYPCKTLRLPCFDDWEPKVIPLGTASIYTALIEIDNNEKKYVMDLSELGGKYILADWLKDSLEYFNEDCLIIGKSPILISLYRNDVWANFDLLYLSRFKLFTRTDMEFYNTYHVRLSIYTDLTLLSELALEKLRSNALVCIPLFKTLAPEYIDLVPKPLSDGSINKYDFWSFIRLLKKTNSNYKNNKEVRRFTVGSCVVVTRRNENAVS